MLRPLAFFAVVSSLAFPVAVNAQDVPDAQGRCVSGCGSTGNNSDARNRQLARAHEEYVKEVQAYNEIERRWNSSVKKGNDFSKKGQKALGKGDCAAANDNFQRELAAFSIDVTSPVRIDDAALSGKYQILLLLQKNSIQKAQNRLAGAQVTCAQRLQTASMAPRSPGVGSSALTKPNSTPPAAGPNAGLVRIGAAAAVKGTVYWLRPDGTKVPIKSGSTIYFGSRIVTEGNGHFQVLLLDETVFTLGPSTDMVLDEFVYDPNTSASKVAASLAKGTFRWVTGKVQRNNPDMKLRLTVGTIGIRGTDFEVKYEPGGQGYIKLSHGALEIQPKTGSSFPMKAGDKAVIRSDGTLLPSASRH